MSIELQTEWVWVKIPVTELTDEEVEYWRSANASLIIEAYDSGRSSVYQQPVECAHEWGTDGMHLNEFCIKCFITKPPREPQREVEQPVKLSKNERKAMIVAWFSFAEQQGKVNVLQMSKQSAEAFEYAWNAALSSLPKRESIEVSKRRWHTISVEIAERIFADVLAPSAEYAGRQAAVAVAVLKKHFPQITDIEDQKTKESL